MLVEFSILSVCLKYYWKLKIRNIKILGTNGKQNVTIQLELEIKIIILILIWINFIFPINSIIFNYMKLQVCKKLQNNPNIYVPSLRFNRC